VLRCFASGYVYDVGSKLVQVSAHVSMMLERSNGSNTALFQTEALPARPIAVLYADVTRGAFGCYLR